MSGSSSPGVAALKSRLEKQGLAQDGETRKGSPPIAGKFSSIKNPSPPSINKLQSSTGSGSPNKKPGSSPMQKPKGAPLFPSQKVKAGSPGSVREGWQGKGQESPRSTTEAKSTLAKVLQGRPDFFRGVEQGSPGLPGGRESKKKFNNSLESSNSEDEDSCFIDKGAGAGLKKKMTVVCAGRVTSVSSAESDLCDLVSSDICPIPLGSRREKELVSSRSEENIAALSLRNTRQAKTTSLVADEGSPAAEGQKKKPLPLLPKRASQECDMLAVEDKNKSRSSSDLSSNKTAGHPVPLHPKPPVAGSKPSVPGGKPKNFHNKDKSPAMSPKPKLPSNKPKSIPSKSASVKTVGNRLDPPKPVENRHKPLLPSKSAGSKSDGKDSAENGLSSPGLKKLRPVPPNKSVKPLQIGKVKEDPSINGRRRRSSSPEDLSLDSHEVKLAIMNTPDEDLLKSDLQAPRKEGPKKEEFEDTLTSSQTRDLESTLVGNGDGISEWVVVKQKKGEERMDREKKRLSGDNSSTNVSKKPSSPATKRWSNNSTPSSSPSPAHSSAHSSASPSTKKKPLPSLPSKEAEMEPQSPKANNSSKFSALMDKFSSQSAAPPPMPGRVYGKAAASEVQDSKPSESTAEADVPPPTPNPSISVTPGSTSSLHSAEAIASTSDVQEKGGSSCRGNTDSGFISEASDDLLLRRDMSVESLPGATGLDRAGEATPSMSSPECTTEEGQGMAEGGEGVVQDGGVAQGGDKSGEDAKPVVVEEVWDEAKLEKARKKRLNIVKELLDTETTYSGRIKVVAVDFRQMVMAFNKKSKQGIPDAAIQQIFLNISPIYSLSENILQELQERMDAWSTKEALGDVICRLAPFLKLYSTYTSGFEDAMRTLTDVTKKDRKFDSMVREFEREKVYTGLGLPAFMLEPVLRIPRYRLLLLDYLKYLPPDSSDRKPTENAIRIISEAADRSNDRIKELETSNELLAIQRSLIDYEGTLLVPSRSFIMKGTLLKSSRKTLSPRFFFLFTDVLLHTYPPENNVYRFRNEMPLCGMLVEDPRVSLMPFSFNIYSTTRSLILVACSEDEKQTWMLSLQTAIQNEVKKTSSLKRDAHLRVKKVDTLFGVKAPLMVPDKSVTMCQMCGTEFTLMFRRHHCRACGKVVCGDCSKQKAYLPYVAKMERVCSPCFFESKNPDKGAAASPATPGEDVVDSPSGSPMINKKQDSVVSTGSGVLNLCGYADDAVVAGYVLCQEGKKWNRMWYQVKRDCVLYKFKAHEDIKAITSLPLPGYTLDPDPSITAITLKHPSGKKNLCETFKVEGLTAYESWLANLGKVVNMELGFSPCSTSPLIHSIEYSSDYKTTSRTSSGASSNPPSRPHSRHTSRPSSRPTSYHSSSRPNSFSSGSSNSRPTSMREASPTSVFKDSFETT